MRNFGQSENLNQQNQLFNIKVPINSSGYFNSVFNTFNGFNIIVQFHHQFSSPNEQNTSQLISNWKQ
uniref:Uncharacterized protein n=1 Tax=Tetranychus urticae TaxID=32264 RepID=T1L487_TETUR